VCWSRILDMLCGGYWDLDMGSQVRVSKQALLGMFLMTNDSESFNDELFDDDDFEYMGVFARAVFGIGRPNWMWLFYGLKLRHHDAKGRAKKVVALMPSYVKYDPNVLYIIIKFIGPFADFAVRACWQ
jgi:hypothetical protein